jgi:hypothetical protein
MLPALPQFEYSTDNAKVCFDSLGKATASLESTNFSCTVKYEIHVSPENMCVRNGKCALKEGVNLLVFVPGSGHSSMGGAELARLCVLAKVAVLYVHSPVIHACCWSTWIEGCMHGCAGTAEAYVYLLRSQPPHSHCMRLHSSGAPFRRHIGKTAESSAINTTAAALYLQPDTLPTSRILTCHLISCTC